MLGGLRRTAVVLLAFALVLSACSPADAGSAGLTINGNGDLVAVVESCGKSIKYVAISDVDDVMVSSGNWSSISPSSGGLELNLDDPGPLWRVETPLQLSNDATYALVANLSEAGDQVWVTKGFYFSKEDLQRLEMGNVMTGIPGFDANPRRILTLEQFRVDACDD